MTITEIPKKTAEQNDSSSPSASKAQEQLTDEDYVREYEEAYHNTDIIDETEDIIEW